MWTRQQAAIKRARDAMRRGGIYSPELLTSFPAPSSSQMEDQASDISPAAGRPFGGTERSWLRAVPGGTGIGVIVLLLSRPVAHYRIEDALRRLESSHPILRSHIATPARGQATFSPTAAQPVPIRVLCASDILPPPPAPVSPFHAILEHELNLNSWSEPAPAHPVLFATAYDGMTDSGRSAVALRFHTGACDRTSVAAIINELLRLLAGDPIEEEGFQRSLEDLIPKKDARKPLWARGKDLVGYSINGLRTSTLRFEDAGSGWRSEVARLMLDLDDTQKLLTTCKDKGIKLCGAIAAAAMLATHSSKHLKNDQYDTYLVVTLIDCRKYLDPVLNSHNIGFYYSGMINTHNIHGGEDVWEIAKRCHTSYSNALNNKKHLKDISELNFLMCKAIDNPHLTPSSAQRTGLISVFEEPIVYETSELQQELGVEDYVGCASSHGAGPSLAVFDTIRDGKLNCAIVYPSPLHTRKQIQNLVEHIRTILTGGSITKEEGTKGISTA